MKKLLSLLLCLVLLAGVLTACGKTECSHRYVNGVCTLCSQTDPKYTANQPVTPQTPCAHQYVEGVCKVCHSVDSNYVANQPVLPQGPCAHNYVDGVCTLCQAPQDGFVAPTYQGGALSVATNGKYLLVDEDGNYGGTRNRGLYGDGAPLNGAYDQVNSLWYATNNDFYHMQSTKLADGTPARTMYTGFSPYQQTMANTSGIAGMVAVLNYWGETVTSNTELDLFNKYQEVNGTTLSGRETAQGLINLWNSLGYTASKSTLTRASTRKVAAQQSMAWFQEHLSAGEMIFVHSYDNEVARWKVIIGFDTMDNGTDQYYDDMLIFADSYDNYDHYQDGYSTRSATQFVQWWMDINANTGAKSNDFEAVLVSPKTAPTISRVLASEDATQIAPESVPENHIIRNWGQLPNLPAGSYGGSHESVTYSSDHEGKKGNYGSGTCMDGKRDHYATHNYFAYPDYYNIQPVEGSRWYLTGYRGFSQTYASSCGQCSAFSILNYYGFDMATYNEDTLVAAYEAAYDRSQETTNYKHSSKGGYPHIIAMSLNDMGVKNVTFGYNILSESQQFLYCKKPVPAGTNGVTCPTYDSFLQFVKQNLEKNQPVAISWRPNGGHWEVIIGYDTMGTDYLYDDVMIFADSGDTWDHYQEGYNVFPATLVYRHWWDLRFGVTQGWFVIDRASNTTNA